MKATKFIALTIASVMALVSCSGSNEPYGKYDLDDYIDPGDYLSVSVTDDEIEAAVNSQIETMLAQNTQKTVITDRGVEMGDIVNIDYAGYMDGELFPNGSDTGYDLTIGSGSFIPGFEEGLIGAKTGETVDVNLNFPDEYKLNPSAAGKPATFKVTINSISVTVKPELTDEFIASIYPSYPTVATYREAMRENVRTSLLWNKVLTGCTVIDYPTEETEKYYEQLVTQFSNMAQANGITLEALVTEYYQMSLDDFLAQSMQYAQAQVASEMTIYTIAEKEGIKLDDAKYQELALVIAVNNGFTTVAELEENYGANAVKISVMRSIVSEHIANAVTAETTDAGTVSLD